MESNGLFVDAVPEKTFYLSNGKSLRNLTDLVSELDVMSQEDFRSHCNDDKDDFATWVADALKASDLAVVLRGVMDKDEYAKVIRSRLYSTAHSNPTKEEKKQLEKELPDIIPNISKTTTKTVSAPNVKNVKVITKIVPEKYPDYSNDLAKLKTTIDAVSKVNFDLVKKVDSLTKTNAELSKKVEAVEKLNSGLDTKVDIVNKVNSELGKKVESVYKINSDLNKKADDINRVNAELKQKTEVLGKNVADAHITTQVSKNVSKYFEDDAFKRMLMDLFKQKITELHSKDRAAVKAEIDKVADLNAELDKKLEVSLANRTKQVELAAQSSVSEALKAHLDTIPVKIDKIMAPRISRMEQAFDKKAESVSAISLTKYKEDVTKEKHDLKAVAMDAMRRELEKIFNDDEHLAKIVARYQKMFADGAEYSAKMHKESQEKLHDELIFIKDRIALDSQNVLNKQLTETIKKQRELLDAELAKALNSNKYFVSRFEKEILNREKLLLESADRKLKENYTKHDGMLGSEYNRYARELGDLKHQFDKDFKTREVQFNMSINSKIHESLNKEFNDILMIQRNELSKSIGIARTSAIDKIGLEFNELLSKHKGFMLEQFNKATTEQALLKDKFVADLKVEEEKMLLKVKDAMQKDLLLTLGNQRELLDKELTKTVTANKFFVERFEKEIMVMNKKLTDSANKSFEENYAKHNKLIQESYDKQLLSLKKMITEADNAITNKEAKIYANLNAIIPASVRESVNKEFSRLILDEKRDLDVELKKAEETNKSIEKKFEDTLHAKSEILIDKFSKDANTRFGELMKAQEQKLADELTRANRLYESLEGKKKDIVERTNAFLDTMRETSMDKLKDLEREYGKHLKKVSQITVLADKVEIMLNDVKETRAQINNDKKIVSKENKDYNEVMHDLTELRNKMSQEYKWMIAYQEKTAIYNLIRQCSNYIKAKDVSNVQLTYKKIVGLYSSAPLEKDDKTEVYDAISALLKESKAAFGNSQQ